MIPITKPIQLAHAARAVRSLNGRCGVLREQQSAHGRVANDFLGLNDCVLSGGQGPRMQGECLESVFARRIHEPERLF